MKVKICGITTLIAAHTAIAAGADFIGFVFAPSKRSISPSAAKEIVQQIDKDIHKVGVFVDETPENIMAIANEVGLDFIQLHGDEPPEAAKQIALPIIKAYSIHDMTPDIAKHYPCDYFLIDSPGERYRGGSGKTFDWTKLVGLGINVNRCILAGGLDPSNVSKAISIVKPIGVDVSSGVETNGVKDAVKMKQFIQQAKAKSQ